jgi:hypothetical protein
VNGEVLAMVDMTNEWGLLAVKLVTDITIMKKESPPKVYLGSLLNFYGKDLAIGTKPKTLLEYVAHNLVAQLIQKNDIKCCGSRIVKDLPIKNTNVYEHIFQTSEGEEFYAIQVGFAPINSVEQLTYSILEMSKTAGCMACNFKGFVEEDIECPTCRNGLVRKVISENPTLKTFRGHGWQIFSKIIGEEFSSIFKDFATEYHLFYQDFEAYLDKAKELAENTINDEYTFGELYGKELERQLLMSFTKYEMVDDDDDETGDDLEDGEQS